MTATASDISALLWAILTDPSDDVSRLVYADAIEEAGEADRAAVIRGDVARPDCSWKIDVQRWRLGEPDVGAVVRLLTPGGLTLHEVPALAHDAAYTHRRGFIDEVSLPLAAFTEDNARWLFSRHPVTRVTLADREPESLYGGYDTTDEGEVVGWGWYLHDDAEPIGPEDIPTALWERLPDVGLLEPARWRSKVYRAKGDALAALSDAATNWGRSIAGLPPLPSPDAPEGPTA